MRFLLSLSMDNAAFEDGEELPTILRSVAEAIERGSKFIMINDSNGNRVGTAAINDNDQEE